MGKHCDRSCRPPCRKGIEIINDYIDPEEALIMHESVSIPGADPSLLSSLKKAVFNNYRKCSAVYRPDDSSLRVISVPGKKREIEILKNNIINMMMNEGYSYHDIGVAAPDISSYALILILCSVHLILL